MSDKAITGQIEELQRALEAQESLRPTLGSEAVDATIATLQEKIVLLEAQLAPPEAQRKQVTVFFADLSGFVAMSETMDIEEVGGVMNALWARLDGVITAHGGIIDKHIGDAVMALFGTPTAREDDAERAVRAALAMQRALQEFGASGGGPYAMPILMRIGINTGSVLLGEVGTTGEFTAMGDTVNVASRLEQAGPLGGVLIAHDTYRHVRGIFDVQALNPIDVRGKSRSVQVYLVQAEKPRASRVAPRGVEGVETRMVGRKTELRQLQGALQRVTHERQAQIVTVVGEAGVGKSRLLYEFDNWIELQAETVKTFRGQASQEMQNLPYALIRDLFVFRFEIRDSDSMVLACEKLEAGLSTFLDEEEMHFIGHQIGFDFSSSPYLSGILDDARQIRDRAFRAAAHFFAAVAQDVPVVIFLEDTHWADESSLDLINHLAQSGQYEMPVLIVSLARPPLYERRPSWGEGEAYHTRLNLPPLSREESLHLVEEIMQRAEETPSDLRDLIVKRAEGNPFYVEELVKMMVDDGVIVTGEERWEVEPQRLTQVRVPPTLTGVVQARLDRLPPMERATLQRASVVGRVFWGGAVERLRVKSDEGDGHTGAMLDALCRRELVFRREESAFSSTQEYIFKHTILRDVTYESVLLRLRREYHAQVAKWLVERSGERVNEYAGLIGEHYERAEEIKSAAEWYARAGRQAQDTFAQETAVDYYHKALNLIPEIADRPSAAHYLRMYEGLGEILRMQARYEEAEQAFREMEVAAETGENKAAQARALIGLTWVHDRYGEHRAALAFVQRAEQLARAAGPSAQVELSKTLYTKGTVYFRLGDGENALALGKQALKLSTTINARREIAHSLDTLALGHILLGQYDQANSYLRDALARFRELGDRTWAASMLNNLGKIARIRGDYHAALALYEEALVIAREIGYQDREMMFLSNIGGAQAALGEYEAAEARLREVIRLAEIAGWEVGLSETYYFLAEASLGQGKLDEAHAAARQALALGQNAAQPELVGRAWRALGMVAARLPGPIVVEEGSYDVESCFVESSQLFSKIGTRGERARTLREWAVYEVKHGDKAQGEALWQEAREIFVQLGLEKEVERMRDRD